MTEKLRQKPRTGGNAGGLVGRTATVGQKASGGRGKGQTQDSRTNSRPPT